MSTPEKPSNNPEDLNRKQEPLGPGVEREQLNPPENGLIYCEEDKAGEVAVKWLQARKQLLKGKPD